MHTMTRCSALKHIHHPSTTMNIRSSIYSIAIASLLLGSCSKQESKPAEEAVKVTGDPRDPIVTVVKAINAQDTAAYAKTLTQTQLKYYQEYSGDINRGIGLFKVVTLTANILSAHVDSMARNVGYVKFAITASGGVNMTDDTVEQQVIFEDGAWKQQWIFEGLQKIIRAIEPRNKK
jgi:hypothetical protein